MNARNLGVVTVLAAAAALSGCGKAKRTLHVYTWSDYMSPEVVEGFKAEYGCDVVVDTFDSNETMYAKLKAGGSGYDVITPSSYLVPLMAREKLISELDHSRMPNVKKNFDKTYSSQILDPEFKYSVPYAVTYTGFMYAKDKVPEGADVNSWKILGNPAIRGKATLLDDIREVVGAGLMSLGYSINSRSPEEIAAATEEVFKWKQNIRKFDAESYKTEVPSGATWIGLGYSTDVMQVVLGDEEAGDAPRPDIGFALPKEGFTISFDEMVLSSSAPEPELAHAFMNYLYTAEASKLNMEYNRGPMPVAPGIAALDEDLRKSFTLDAETLSRGQVLMPVDDDPAVKALYDKAWDRIKATSEQ